MNRMLALAFCMIWLSTVSLMANTSLDTKSSSDPQASAETADAPVGRFGGAFDPQRHAPYGATALANPEYMDFPFTVELWVKLSSSATDNLILANGYVVGPYNIKTNHWRLHSQLGTGKLYAWFDCIRPAMIQTETVIADGKWHYIAMTADWGNVRLFVDGQYAGGSSLTPYLLLNAGDRHISEGPLFVGGAAPYYMQCNGLIDELRFSNGMLPIGAVPTEPFKVEPNTVGLWHFDEPATETRYNDVSGAGNDLMARPVGATLDEDDRLAFGITTSPFSRPMDLGEWQVDTEKAPAPAFETSQGAGIEEILLNGRWDCVESAPRGVSEEFMMQEEAWRDAIPANVPCTIQTALLEAGRIPDPMVEMNAQKVQWVAEREWWLRRTFDTPKGWRGERVRLLFEGVDYRATFWLNGRRLGLHEGMWGGPEYEVGDLLRSDGKPNVLMVQLDPAPSNYQDTLKNNVAYGWHYVKMITLGIWRPVRLQLRGDSELRHPFLTTVEVTSEGAKTELALDVWHWGEDPEGLRLDCRLDPVNFDGPSYTFSEKFTVQPGANRFGYEGFLKGVQLWQPVRQGHPSLYRFSCVLRDGRKVLDRAQSNWGAREIRMDPVNGRPDPKNYNWQLTINGRSLWLCGANWCIPDALLRMDRPRLKRLLELAAHAGVQFLRVWGGGPVENDDFYDLCDEMGILVQQEFSMLGFHRLENVPSVHALDMTNFMVPRLRNRPSLASWCGANEIPGHGRIVEVLGRRILELDGTRPFRRSNPMGGDNHYHVYWTQEPLLRYRELSKTVVAFTEFGMSSPANLETWRRVLPKEELDTLLKAWPPDQNSVFAMHTPTFSWSHFGLMERYVREFLAPRDLPSVIQGMQLAQSLGDKFMIEGMRARKPETSATYVYKLTENYPSCSWALIDYYGVPKSSYYTLRANHAPVHVMAGFDAWDSKDDELKLTLHAVNDTTQSVSGQLVVDLYDGQFGVVAHETQEITVPTDRAVNLGEKGYVLPKGSPRPLFLRLDLKQGDKVIDRNWYFFDFVAEQGSLFSRPQTQLETDLQVEGDLGWLTIRNTGNRPALNVEIDLGDASNTYYAEDSAFWMEPGETRRIFIRRSDAIDGQNRTLREITVKAWNAPAVSLIGWDPK